MWLLAGLLWCTYGCQQGCIQTLCSSQQGYVDVLLCGCVQGSESDTVVYYVGDHKLQNWKHVYTAVTRGRKAVFLVGKESELRLAVWERDRPRRSRLARRLTNMMKDVQFQVKTRSHSYM